MKNRRLRLGVKRIIQNDLCLRALTIVVRSAIGRVRRRERLLNSMQSLQNDFDLTA